MDVFFASARVRLKDADLLGEGGEARVYRFNDLALKVFHPVAPGTPEAAVRAQKLKKLAVFPSALPSEVVTPLSTLTDVSGATIGYAMRAVTGADVGRVLRDRELPVNELKRLNT